MGIRAKTRRHMKMYLVHFHACLLLRQRGILPVSMSLNMTQSPAKE